jgi:light-regulated signal transduction histidine kinase (bacteriophytochrome)
VSGSPTGLRGDYLIALQSYLAQGDEATLHVAYELGRRAMIEGHGVVDMAAIHRDACAALVISPSIEEGARLVTEAGSFFQETLSPFEMSFRGYREANEALQNLNEALREEKAAAETANRELEAFSYSVSHDLRAPLRSINGFSAALLEECADQLDEQGKRYLGRVLDATRRMEELIEDLLKLARVTRAEMSRVEVDLSEVAHRIVERLRAAEPVRVVRVEIAKDLHASCDARLVAIVLENLLGNAWKFTSRCEDGEIEFGRIEREGVLAFAVRDNGAGFDMRYAGKLFGVFERLHSTSDFEGTGIGLATAQRVIHRHRGRIWGEGKVGAGATFYFTLGEGGPIS